MAVQAAVSTFDIDSIAPILNKVLRGVNIRDREDVRQEAIIRVLTEVKKGSAKKNTTCFMYTVIQRTVYDYYRKKNRLIIRNSISVNFNDGLDESNKHNSCDFFTAQMEDISYILADVHNDYETNLKVFTPQERKIINFMLYTEEGMAMKPTEISNFLGLNKSHASRAMSKLKKVCRA